MLTYLSHEHFCSETCIAQKMGISCETVRQQIQVFKNNGLPVLFHKKHGYRLLYPIEWLDPKRILAALSPNIQNQVAALDVFVSIPSTNTYLLKSQISGHACLAEHQSQGRGRRGKTWISPLCGNLYGSLRWHFSKTPQELGGLSLVAGLAVIHALQEYGISGLSLKWPNDVWRNHRKLGGILVEFSGEQGGSTEAIIGIGVNATKCCEHPLKRNKLAALLLEALCEHSMQFETFGFSYFQKKWEQWDALAGKNIILTFADGLSMEGMAEGVDERGALLVTQGLERRAYHGGEVSVRSASL